MKCQNKRKLLLSIGILVLILVLIMWRMEDKKQAENMQSEKIPELQVYVVLTASDAAWERISRALSEQTEEKLGCSVRLHGVEPDNYWDFMQQRYLNEETMDVWAVFQQNSLVSLVNKGWLIPLDDYIEPYLSGIEQEISSDIIRRGVFQNQLFALPSNQQVSKSLGFVMRKEIVDELGIDVSRIKNMEDIHQVLKLVKSKYPDIAPLGAQYGAVLNTLGQDSLGNNLGVLLDPASRSTEVKNLYSSELYYNYCKMMHQWYQEGLILEHAYDCEFSYNQLMNENVIFAAFNNGGQNENKINLQKKKREIVQVNITNPIVSTDCSNLYWGISGNAKYPELAAQFLNLMYTDEEIIKTCVLGAEGIDYEEKAEKITMLDTAPEVQWNSIAWSWPNASKLDSYWEKSTNTVYDVYEEHYSSPANGFVFDSSKVNDQVDLCSNVVEKYNNVLLSGYLDPDEVLPLFLEELEQAGINLIIEEKQRQLAEWR